MLSITIALLFMITPGYLASYNPNQHCLTTATPFNAQLWNYTYNISFEFVATSNGIVLFSREGVRCLSFEGEVLWNFTLDLNYIFSYMNLFAVDDQGEHF
jgi:hypothetical protein